jgi:hypothetical protein
VGVGGQALAVVWRRLEGWLGKPRTRTRLAKHGQRRHDVWVEGGACVAVVVAGVVVVVVVVWWKSRRTVTQAGKGPRDEGV